MSQTLSNVLLHIVFSTKNRVPTIAPQVEDDLHRYIATVCRSLGCPALEVGGTEDHVHICCRLSMTITISDLVKKVKTSSSKWVKGRGREFWDFFWQSGYGAFSIGVSNLPKLRAYIMDQKEHHRRRTFKDEFRALLRKYNIDYDERYVWDDEIVS